MSERMAVVSWMICLVLIVMAWALFSTGCAGSVPHTEHAFQGRSQALQAEINEACSRSPAYTLRRHTPVYTASGMAVWCGQ